MRRCPLLLPAARYDAARARDVTFPCRSPPRRPSMRLPETSRPPNSTTVTHRRTTPTSSPPPPLTDRSCPQRRIHHYRESRPRPCRTGQRRDIFPTASARSSSSSKSGRVTAFPAAIKGRRRVPHLTPHCYSRIPLLPRHPSATAPSTTTSRPPPPRTHFCTPSQPKVGRGIEYP
jgi:hypothetical protein